MELCIRLEFCPPASTTALPHTLHPCFIETSSLSRLPPRPLPMSKEGILQEVFSPLLKQLANAKLLADTSFQGDDNLSEIRLLLEKIERVVGDMKGVILRARRWEMDVMDELGLVARHVDEILEHRDGGHGFRLNLLRVEEDISRIKEHVTPTLQLPPLESCDPLSPSWRPMKDGSEKPPESVWWQLELERRILESSAMAELQVSYDTLDLQLRLCLLCFSIFPEDSVIKKKALVYWWIGEGLVSPAGANTAEEVGEKCFRELISKRLIEPIRRKHTPVVDCCRMHPWIRRMLVSVARRGEFFDFDQEGNPTPDSSRSRRACLKGGKRGSQPQMIMSRQARAEELSTLFNVDEPYLGFRKGWLTNLRKVAVLHLGRWQTSAKHHIEVEDTDFLEGLGSLRHLRYLSLQGISRIRELPASIADLSNLRILDLRSCHNLEKLAAGVTSLKRLTHLDVSECYLLEHMPRGLGSLVKLQVLKGFVIGNPRSRDPCRLSELTSLQKLRKLSVSIGSAAVVAGGEISELQRLGSLRSLTITWGVVSLPSRKGTAKLTRAATMTMSSLRFPPNLEKLDLRCFPRLEPPEWLNPTALSGLKKLYIRGGRLGSLGLTTAKRWGKVEVLRLRFLGELQTEWSALQAAFPSLIYLEMYKCDKLTSFPCGEDGVWVRSESEKRENPDPSHSWKSNAVVP